MTKEEINTLKEILPIYPGINGKEEYFNSAILVLLMMIDNEYHFVFQKRAKNIRQGGEICFPGGRFDEKIDTDLETTAIRETVEELGISSEKIQIIGKLDTVIGGIGATVDGFLAVIDILDINELNPNLDEVDKVFTVPVSFFENHLPEQYKINIKIQSSITNKMGQEEILLPVKDLGLPDRYLEPWGNSKRNVYVYKVKGEVIWGITANFVFDIVNKLKQISI